MNGQPCEQLQRLVRRNEQLRSQSGLKIHVPPHVQQPKLFVLRQLRQFPVSTAQQVLMHSSVARPLLRRRDAIRASHSRTPIQSTDSAALFSMVRPGVRRQIVCPAFFCDSTLSNPLFLELRARHLSESRGHRNEEFWLGLRVPDIHSPLHLVSFGNQRRCSGVTNLTVTCHRGGSTTNALQRNISKSDRLIHWCICRLASLLNVVLEHSSTSPSEPRNVLAVGPGRTPAEGLPCVFTPPTASSPPT